MNKWDSARIFRWLSFGLLLLLPGSVFGEPGSVSTKGMALWERAVSVAAANRELVPGSVYTRVTMSDGSGTVKNEQETWSRIGVGPDGKLETTVIRSVKDGRGDTEGAQREIDKHPERNRFQYSLLPVMPANQNKVRAQPTGAARAVDGIECAGFSFTMPGERNTTMTGTVWIAEPTGAPMLMEFTFAPLPPGVNSVTNTLRFHLAHRGSWELGSMDTHAEGQLLFFHRIFELHMEFSNYFRYAPRDDEARSSR